MCQIPQDAAVLLENPEGYMLQRTTSMQGSQQSCKSGQPPARTGGSPFNLSHEPALLMQM